eukprot:7426569-Alexandrium_andersonii.AAC.1
MMTMMTMMTMMAMMKKMTMMVVAMMLAIMIMAVARMFIKQKRTREAPPARPPTHFLCGSGICAKS